MIIETRPVGPFAMNTYVVVCPQTRQAALIDAGGEIGWVAEQLKRHEARLERILQTHAHIDHIGGLGEAKRRWPEAPILMHAADAPIYEAAPMMGQMFGMRVGPLPPIDRHVTDGETVSVGSLRLEVLFTPGHAPGHVVFYERAAGVALSGDLLFSGSIGRTDLPGCDPKAMAASLRRFMTLDDHVRVLSGHGPETTIGRERATNPFIRGLG